MNDKLFEQVASIARNETDRLLTESETKKTILGVKEELRWVFGDYNRVNVQDIYKEIEAMAEKI